MSKRKGSRKGQDFTAQGINNVANAFKDITTNKIPNAIGKLTERDGSRKGATLVDGKSPMDYLKMLEELQGFREQRDIIQSGDEDAAEEYLKEDADNNGKSYEESVRSIAEEFEDDSYLGGRKGSRMGAYGGKSPEHQSSIKAAVSVAMSDRRL